MFCTQLPSVANGDITYSTGLASSLDHGTTATITCNEGFFLEGNSERVCQGNGIDIVGAWSGSQAACSGVHHISHCQFCIKPP